MSIRMVDRSQPRAKTAPRPRTSKRPALVPAAARVVTALTPAELDLSGDAIETFTLAVGGRKKLLATLTVADSDTSTDKVVNTLLDPAYASWSLRRICAYAGITVAELFASYKKALFVQAHIEAAHLITQVLPPIVADVMARALPGKGPCPRCHGAPTTPGLTACPVCDGAGTVATEPGVERQKLALELGRLLERKAGVVMQQNVTAAASALQSSHPGSLEQLQQAVGDLLFSPNRRRALSPIDVAVQDPREPGHPQTDPERPDVPLPIDEPESPETPADDEEEDEDQDDEPLNA